MSQMAIPLATAIPLAMAALITTTIQHLPIQCNSRKETLFMKIAVSLLPCNSKLL